MGVPGAPGVSEQGVPFPWALCPGAPKRYHPPIRARTGAIQAQARARTIAPIVRREPFTEARLLTVNEVADLLRVSRMTVYRLIKNGEMPALRVGRSYRLREEDVHTYLRERYTEAG